MASTRLAFTLLLITLVISVQGCCCCMGGGSSSSGGKDPGDELVSAARKGDAQRVRALVESGVSPRSSTWSSGGSRLGSSTSAIQAAVISGNWEAVEPLLVDEEMKTEALYHALRWTDLEIVQRLVERGAKAEPSWAFEAYMAALRMVNRHRAETLVKLIVELGLDPNVTWSHGSTKSAPIVNVVVGHAAWRRKEPMPPAGSVEERIANPGEGERGLDISTWAPEVFILIAKPRLDVQDGDGTTPLMKAASAGKQELVRFLLEQGADPTLVDKEGLTAAAHAAQLGHHDLAALLQKARPPKTPE